MASGNFFGAVQVDIQVPHDLKDKFHVFSPLFATIDIPFESIGVLMQQHCRDTGLHCKSRRLLVGGMSAQKLLLATPLLAWYLRHGLVVTRVHQAVEYRGVACFKPFIDECTEARREGDRNSNMAVTAQTAKILCNSGYGSLCMAQSKFNSVVYRRGQVQACQLVNKPQFKSLDEMTNALYEVKLKKYKIKHTIPVQLAFFVLCLAKERLYLCFYFDFLHKYLLPQAFGALHCDTDSVYIALSRNSLQEAVKPHMLEAYKSSILDHCHKADFQADGDHFLCRECCQECAAHDLRSVGLFKVECTGTKFIGLCSKTYVVQESEGGGYKFSSKGVQKARLIGQAGDVYERYKSVLTTGQPYHVTNMGFRHIGHTTYTYTLRKKALSYLYVKRVVGLDGISTSPLPLVLKMDE